MFSYVMSANHQYSADITTIEKSSIYCSAFLKILRCKKNFILFYFLLLGFFKDFTV